MPWCPKCKNEYVEGKTYCHDCDVELVEELPDETGEETQEPGLTAEELADIAARQAATAHMTTYTSAQEKYAETKSSAWTFLILGAAGFLIVTLSLLGILSLPLNTFALAMLEIMFVSFLAIAFLSFRNAGNMSSAILQENDLDARIREWAAAHLDPEELAAGLELDISEEMKYFTVSEEIRRRIMTAFPEVDDSYAEELTERFYNELY